MTDEYTERAKQLLYEKLAANPDRGVRAVNEVVELADDHPSVVKVAAALRAKDRVND